MPLESEAGGILQRDALIGLHCYWRNRQFEYSSGDLIYMGMNEMENVSDDTATWAIFKYTLGADGITKIQGPITGSWTNRATLAWS